jgi:hypothetical protein
MPDLDDPADLPEIRRTLREAGIDPEPLSDDEARDAMRQLLKRAIPAPAVPAGSPPVSGRVWLAEALTAGGFQQPEDKDQQATLDDGGPSIHLAILGVLVMRHMSGATPTGWTDEALAERVGFPLDDLRRGQKLLDEVAAEVGRPATPEPRWWLRD